jgi:hypothetical protein
MNANNIIAKKYGLDEEIIAKSFKKIEQEFEDADKGRKQAYAIYENADKIWQEAYNKKILMQQEIKKAKGD